MSKAVPPPPVALLIETVTATAEAVTLEATMLLTLLTVLTAGVKAVHTVGLVLLGVRYVVTPKIEVTLTMFGFAIIAP